MCRQFKSALSHLLKIFLLFFDSNYILNLLNLFFLFIKKINLINSFFLCQTFNISFNFKKMNITCNYISNKFNFYNQKKFFNLNLKNFYLF
ncbi:MAG: hypothetical protein ACSHUF_00110 [Candidatus Nasuia deltocephalinicola]